MRRSIAATVISIGLLSGCAGQGDLEPGEVADPIEPANRMIFAINETLDTFVLQPTAYVYKETVPPPVQDMVRNFLDWLRSPVILANDLLQQDWKAAEVTASRFIANAPLFGLVDNATGLGLTYRNEDFGQTLAVWGADDGAYIVLPVLGPSNVRDAVGRGVDFFFDPAFYIGNPDTTFRLQIAQRVADGVDFRARNFDAINDLKTTSVDYYARLRSIYKQRRDSDILNGAPADYPDDAPTSSSSEFDNYLPGDASEGQTGTKPSSN